MSLCISTPKGIGVSYLVFHSASPYIYIYISNSSMKMAIYKISNKSSWQWRPIIALNIHEKSHLKRNIFFSFLF